MAIKNLQKRYYPKLPQNCASRSPNKLIGLNCVAKRHQNLSLLTGNAGRSMNAFLKNSTFLLACSLVLCFSASVYANDLPHNIELNNIELIKPTNSQIKQINPVKQEKTKQNLNAQLLMASQNGNIAEVRSLISQATDVNVRDEYGWTPILWAAMNGHTDIVRVLLVSGANPNTRNKYGWTPLMWSAGQGYSEIVRSLIASGARLNAQDRNGWTAMMWASDGNQQETVAILRNGANE